VWGENSSNEQHSFGKLPILLPIGARNEISSEHSRANISEHNRASSNGSVCISSGMHWQQLQQRAASTELQDQGAEQVPSASTTIVLLLFLQKQSLVQQQLRAASSSDYL
jgi:hypothetical protein